MLGPIKTQFKRGLLHLHTELTPGYCLNKYENMVLDTLILVLFCVVTYVCCYVPARFLSNAGFASPFELTSKMFAAYPSSASLQ